MEIRVLTFADCPSCATAYDLVRDTIRHLHIKADLMAISVTNEEQAERYRFLGSPTIQVDGLDIEPARRNDLPSMACRLYRTQRGIARIPPQNLLTDALTEALKIRG